MTALLEHWLAPTLRTQATQLAQQFQAAKPFRHLVLDNFLRLERAQALLAQFPDFALGNARDESGQLGGKSVVEDIRTLGAEYTSFDALLQSPPWLALISSITGIPALQYDPQYFGGGTHDNRDGQELDPHVDFNRHPRTHAHRRLNVIVYLNRNWQDAWGGALELHSNPRAPDNQITRVAPQFNRCVIFETTERSWHAFGRIHLPEPAAQSRKSVAIYLYSAARPAHELADLHSTVYVDRPFADAWQAGRVLSGEDMHELSVQLVRRDQHIERLYKQVQALMTENDALQRILAMSQLQRATRLLRRGWNALRGQS